MDMAFNNKIYMVTNRRLIWIVMASGRQSKLCAPLPPHKLLVLVRDFIHVVSRDLAH